MSLWLLKFTWAQDEAGKVCRGEIHWVIQLKNKPTCLGEKVAELRNIEGGQERKFSPFFYPLPHASFRLLAPSGFSSLRKPLKVFQGGEGPKENRNPEKPSACEGQQMQTGQGHEGCTTQSWRVGATGTASRVPGSSHSFQGTQGTRGAARWGHGKTCKCKSTPQHPRRRTEPMAGAVPAHGGGAGVEAWVLMWAEEGSTNLSGRVLGGGWSSAEMQRCGWRLGWQASVPLPAFPWPIPGAQPVRDALVRMPQGQEGARETCCAASLSCGDAGSLGMYTSLGVPGWEAGVEEAVSGGTVSGPVRWSHLALQSVGFLEKLTERFSLLFAVLC